MPLPPELSRQLAALYKRLADLYDGATTVPLPMRVVVHDASAVLADPVMRDAVEEIARHGHRVGVELEIRNAGPRACQYVLGGSQVLLSAIVQGRVTFVPSLPRG